MSGIGPGEISEGVSNVYNLIISTESAQILTQSFEPFFKKGFWEIWASTFAAGLSFLAAIASIVVAWITNKNSLNMQKKLLEISENSIKIQQDSLTVSKNSTQIAHDMFIAELDKLYFEIRQKLPDDYKKLSIKEKMLMCNFLEKVCSSFYHKKITKEELSVYGATLKIQSYVDYSKTSNRLGNYKKWLRENNLII